MKKRILFVAHEMQPYLKISDIADIARSIPQSMQEMGMEIRVLMPRYGYINERRHRLHEVVRLSGINIMIGENDNPLIIKVASLPAAKMQVYFLDNEEFFQRKYGIRDGSNNFYDDNHERMIFFCKGALETVNKLGWSPDIIHCNGWMTSLIPLYVKKLYHNNPIFKDTKVVYSVYDNQFSEKLGSDFTQKGMYEDINMQDMAMYDKLSNDGLDQGAIFYADGVINATTEINSETQALLNSLEDKMIITHDENDYTNQYHEFYSKVLANQSVLI